MLYELQKFHYDVAPAAHAIPLGALLKMVPAKQVLFGTDFPFAGDSDVAVQGLTDYGLSANDLRAVERDNALRLVPRLGTVG